MELFKLVGTIVVNGAEEAEKKTGTVTNTAQESAKKIGTAFKGVGTAFETIGKTIVKAAEVGAAAISTVSAGITALTKSAIDNYAEYEQLVGGVETLFKDSSDKVVEYANQAYKTAGLSANDYMETVTSFSASLLQSLDNDTVQATEIANMAITDMSDNANKMGTDMSMIQNAYQGFAKQNYTMLDNLKLGYGGTKEEMERLLADAGKLTGIEYDISSFSDIVEAIHAIQTEMDITGTTSKEASTTIQGSIASMKASWTNFMTGMSDESQDFDSLVNNVIDSVLTVGSNLVPRLIETLPRLIDGLSQLVQKIVPYIPQVLKTLVPAIIDGAKQLLSEITGQLPDILETILPGFGGELGKNIVKIIDSLKSVLSKIVPMLQKLGNKVMPVIYKLIDKLLPAFENIVEELLPPLENILDILLPLLLDIADAVLPAFEKLLPLIADALVIVLEPLAEMIESALPILNQLLGILIPLIEGVLDFLSPILDVVGNLFTGVTSLISGALEPLAKAFGFVAEKTDPAVEAARKEAEKLADVKKAADEAREAIDKKTAKDLEAVGSTQDLWQELQTLCDEEGKVMDKDKDRAAFITEELEKALGIEIEWTDNQIEGYQELQKEIDNTIAKKRLEILMAGSEEKYAEAIKNRAEAEKEALTAFTLQQEKLATLDRLDAIGVSHNSDQWIKVSEEAAAYGEAYATAKYNADAYYKDIAQYEEAQSLMLQGKTEEAMELLSNQGDAFVTANDLAKKSSEEALQILENQIADAAVALAQSKNALETMAANADEATRKIYQQNYEDAKEFYEKTVEEYRNAGGEISTELFRTISDSMSDKNYESVGVELVDGIANGIGGNKAKVAQEVASMWAEAMEPVMSGSIGEKIVEKTTSGILDTVGTFASRFTSINGSSIGDKLISTLNSLSDKTLSIFLDSGELVGALAPGMDSVLGDRFQTKGRGM